MPETVQQAMDGEEAELGDHVVRLRLRALHADRDVTNTPDRWGASRDAIISREGEHVCGRIDLEEPLVERSQLRVVREPHGELSARTHAERVTAAPQELSDPCRADIAPLPR